MDILFALTAAALYFAALLKIVPGLLEPNQIATHRVFTLALLALIFHAGTLVDLILQDTGQNLSILNVASLVSFILAAIATSLMLRMRIWILLPVVYTFSAINLTAATLLPSNVLTHLETKPEVLIHIALAIFAYATLMLATLYAIQLAWLDHQLKTKKRNVINPNLPPLMAVERQLFKIILVGEALLTVSLVTGFIFVDDMFAQGKSHQSGFIFNGMGHLCHFDLGTLLKSLAWKADHLV